MAVMAGKAADVGSSVVSDWSSRLQSMCDGYALKDIFNADKTGLFFTALPTRQLAIKGEKAKRGKKSKERITVLLTCFAIGEKLTALVIGHSANCCCFRSLDSSPNLPVTYTSNRRA